MIKKIKIVTDSSITVNPEILKRYKIIVVPLSVMIDGTIYSEENIDRVDFMTKMKQATELPKTSQPAIGKFVEAYQKLISDDSVIISIHLTKFLSGTAETARQASLLVNGEIHVVDSGFLDQGLAFQVEQAAKMAEDNRSVPEILAKINEIKEKTKIFLGVSSLENLVKGGRVSRITGFLTGLLNIKAIMELTLTNGLELVTKGRGEKTFWRWVDELITHLKSIAPIKRIGISHADGLEIANKIKEMINNIMPDLEIKIFQTGAIVATHTGEKAFAVMYYTS